jgi:hypothetical protein
VFSAVPVLCKARKRKPGLKELMTYMLTREHLWIFSAIYLLENAFTSTIKSEGLTTEKDFYKNKNKSIHEIK